MTHPFENLTSSLEHRYLEPTSEIATTAPARLRPSRLSRSQNMFLEDLGQRAFPYGIAENESFSAEIRSTDHAATKMIAEAIPSIYPMETELTHSLRVFTHAAVENLALGYLYLEIEYFWPSEAAETEPVKFRINLLRQERVIRKAWRYHYWIPSSNKSKTWSKERLNKASLVRVSLPVKLRCKLRRALRTLRAFDNNGSVATDWMSEAYGQKLGFDYSLFMQQTEAIALRNLRAVGWTGRGSLSQRLLDPTKAWRAIQFDHIVVQMRDIALEGLQQAINKAGEVFGFEAKILITGELTQAHLKQLEAD